LRINFVDLPIRWVVIFHVVCGSLALATMLVPILSKKGGKIHVKAGWIYTYAMVVVGSSALVITPWRAFLDPARNSSSISFAVFLFFIAIFTLSALWEGITVLKFKDRKTPSKNLSHIGPPVLTVFFGIIAQLVGWRFHNTLLLVFPFLGHISAKRQLEYWLRPPLTKMHWWYAHMNGMSTACIATLTAFLVTAVPRIWPSPLTRSPILWIAPGVIFGTILKRWIALYKKKFNEDKVYS
jgi:uncharacterized membrane protein